VTTNHDDRPHPVPPYAWLRWKENYFFIVMDRENEVYGISHLNNEPLFSRSRFALNLVVQGQPLRYASEVPFPADFDSAPVLSDGKLSLHFREPHRRFDLDFEGEDFGAAIRFEARRPTFDFVACRSAAPEQPSFQEVMTLGLNLPYNHQQQSLKVTGTVTVRTSGRERRILLDGLGYRDHSWSMRTDNISRRHVWTGLNFPDRAFGIKVLETTHRPGLWAKEGYVSDADGERALRVIDVTHTSTSNGWPTTTRFAVRDVQGRAFTIEADIAGRFADVPLHAEKSVTGAPSYEILETFSPLKLLETGELGIGLVEIGRHPSLEDAYQ
jgi:hypothetical protein